MSGAPRLSGEGIPGFRGSGVPLWGPQEGIAVWDSPSLPQGPPIRLRFPLEAYGKSIWAGAGAREEMFTPIALLDPQAHTGYNFIPT